MPATTQCKSNDPAVKAVWEMMARSKVDHDRAKQFRRSNTTIAKSHAHNAIKHMVNAAEYAQEHLTSEEQCQHVLSTQAHFSPVLFRCMQHALEGGAKKNKRKKFAKIRELEKAEAKAKALETANLEEPIKLRGVKSCGNDTCKDDTCNKANKFPCKDVPGCFINKKGNCEGKPCEGLHAFECIRNLIDTNELTESEKQNLTTSGAVAKLNKLAKLATESETEKPMAGGGGDTALAAMHAGDRTPESVLLEWKRSLDALRVRASSDVAKDVAKDAQSFLSGTELHWSDLCGGGNVVEGDLLRLSDMMSSGVDEEESIIMEFDVRSEVPSFW